MLSNKSRFHGHGSLRYVFRHGESVRSPQVTLKYSHNPRRKNSRYTVIVSKKIMKSAVGRNRMRRRLYEIIRRELPHLKDNHDTAVMIFSSEVMTMGSSELNDLMKRLFSQAGLYK